MFKKLTLAAAALATVATAAAPTAASAQSWRGDRYERDYRDGRGYREYRGDRGYYRDRQYNRRGARCENGDGGTVIGAIAGGLLGNTVAGRGNRLLGTTPALLKQAIPDDAFKPIEGDDKKVAAELLTVLEGLEAGTCTAVRRAAESALALARAELKRRHAAFDAIDGRTLDA